MRSVADCRDNHRFSGRPRVASSIEPGCERLRARRENRWRRDARARGRSLDQIEMQLVQVIERMTDPHQPLFESTEIKSFQGERLDEVLDLPQRLAGWRVSGGFASRNRPSPPRTLTVEVPICPTHRRVPRAGDFAYCTARARSRVYSSAEIVPEFFNRSSFSISSATL